ncbi:tyrosine-type recombinase/integrase [Gordonia terrae]|uniref:tyrosine-type recombinase/integrase n=1 Tax=Gordonia terrae TaxID=2055 RepID=UPI003F6B95E1
MPLRGLACAYRRVAFPAEDFELSRRLEAEHSTPRSRAAHSTGGGGGRVALGPLGKQFGKRSAGKLVWPPITETRWVTIGALRCLDSAVKSCMKSVEGFPKVRPHQLRHTYASLAISAGANVKVLQTLLGHKTATTTLDRTGT